MIKNKNKKKSGRGVNENGEIKVAKALPSTPPTNNSSPPPNHTV